MSSKMKMMVVALVSLSFVVVPMTALAGGYPKGDNSVAIVGVPKGWAPKVEGQSSGGGGKKYPPGNDHAIVGVPGKWKPSMEASKWGADGTIASRTKGNDRAIVGVPGPWKPK